MAGPTPHNDSTARGCKNASSSAARTTTTPGPGRVPRRLAVGLAALEANLATILERPTPTEQASDSRSCTWRRMSAAMSSGGPSSRRAPVTSKNASSSPIGSTVGVTSWRTAWNWRLISEYRLKCPSTKTAPGQSWRARTVGMAERTPKARAS